jgi:hypothetical protein
MKQQTHTKKCVRSSVSAGVLFSLDVDRTVIDFSLEESDERAERDREESLSRLHSRCFGRQLSLPRRKENEEMEGKNQVRTIKKIKLKK